MLYDLEKLATTEVALHTSRPEVYQSEHEVYYSGYARIVIFRDDWSKNGRILHNINDIGFPMCVYPGSWVTTHISIGSNNRVIVIIPLDNPILVMNGSTVIICSNGLKIEADSLLTCKCKLTDNTDQYLNMNPGAKLIPEGYLNVDVNLSCEKHGEIYQWLQDNNLSTTCTIEFLRKVEFKQFRDGYIETPRTRMGLINANVYR